jgi:hypothetical protein
MPPSVSESTPERALAVPETSPQSVVRLELSEDEVEVDTTTAGPQLSLDSLPICKGLVSRPVLVLY